MCSFSHFSIFVVVLVSFVQSKPVEDRNDRVGAFYYLNKYGYVPKDANKLTAALMSDDVVKQLEFFFQLERGRTNVPQNKQQQFNQPCFTQATVFSRPAIDPISSPGD